MGYYKQLRIRAYIKTGVISDQYLPLDAVLYYQKVRQTMGAADISKSGESTVRQGGGVRLPIKKSGPGDLWFYDCSFAQFSYPVTENSSFKVKSGDWLKQDQHFKANKKIDIQRGKYKNAHIKLYYRHCEYIDWYCIGNPEDIAQLLKFCTNLGKNAGDGWGEVLRWEIKEWPENWSIRGPQNKLMRNVPLNQNGKGILYGLRPSYWNSRHIAVCKMP